MDHETLGGRIPKGERRVRFADSMGMELVSIFLTDLFVLASHTPYTNYGEHKKPPSSRLSSTLQAMHDQRHQHHHNHHNYSGNNTTTTFAATATAITTTATRSINNNNQNFSNKYNNNNNNNIISKSIISNGTSDHYSSYNNYHNTNHHAKVTSKQQQSPSSFKSSPSPAPPSSPPVEFICEFTQPVSLISFKERVKLKKVHLESCYINTTAGHVSLTCNIRVLNISYDKSISVRYTTDDWASHTDSLASYKPGSCDGWSDQFTSTISIINKLQPGQRMIFAVRFASGGVVYWDNNGGLNYSVKSKCAGSN